MKFTVIVSLFAALFAACAAEKMLTDLSTINDSCPNGCNSALKVKLQSKGTGSKWWIAKVDCYRMAQLTPEEVDGVCKPLCGLLASPKAALASAQICSLCGGNSGKGLTDCRQQLSELVSKVQEQCITGDAVSPSSPGGSFEMYSSATVTKDYPGAGCK